MFEFIDFQFTGGRDASGAGYEKTFWYPSHYRGTWIEAKTMCKHFKMELISLDSEAEANYFLNLFSQTPGLFDKWTHIGAVTSLSKSKSEWYWAENAKKANFTLKFLSGQPDNYGGEEQCLAITLSNGVYGFNDLKCYQANINRFLCQTKAFDIPVPGKHP